MSFLDHIRECNRWQPSRFIPFRVESDRVGLIRRSFAEHLRRFPRTFRVAPDGVDWIHPAGDFASRTGAIQEVVTTLVEQGAISHLHGEMYPVTSGSRLVPRMLIDRACAPYFGVRAFGQHLNGFVRDGDDLKLWVARRSADRRVFPNHLDNLVAGGLPWGATLAENLRKECREEADIPAKLAGGAVPVGAVSYCRAAEQGLKPDVMYCYDLELPAEFEPRNTDGEVESFRLVDLEELAHLVADTGAFKLNCNLVIIDFLVRHGVIGPERADYLAIVQGLRSPLP